MRSNALLTAVLGVAVAMSLGAQAQSHSDKAFLEKNSQGNVAEVELAKLALKKSQNPEVRAFAQKMVHDHEMLGKSMAPLMAKAGVQPSVSLNGEHQRLYNKLNGLQGKEFDQEYVQAMDKDHHEDLSDFQSEFNSTKDMELKTAVHKGEEVIAEHTKMIDGISDKMGLKRAGS